ncbi:restriction endonuclease subunit S [Paenibacillus sp. KQZ6P-2]|uniref:Restriction endonuclease subunit S n=1 Tax=Paenibacillus mangrovi TaxID=2931978 RepID=A0A9X1WTN7_9BACL|nr:restriction endonuclease subunit S [Paenibacillus mangrovi]MCJ8013393.1 restriction endonuclease subunit S [Paenibacillus mangrovi]
MSKKNSKSQEELLKEALVPEDEQPYELPANWVWTIMNKVVDVRDGTHDTPKYVDNGYPLVTSKNLKNGLIDFSNVQYISEEDHIVINKRSKVDEYDTLFAMIGTIGNPCYVENIQNEFSIKNVALFKPKLIEAKFLFRYLSSPQYIEPLVNNAKGSTQKFVSLGVLRNSKIPLPPLNEQKRIADKVEKLLNKINHAKQLIEEARATFELRRAAILDKAFRGEFTKNKICLVDNVILNSNKGQMIDDGKSEDLHRQLVNIIPKNWIIHPLGNLLREETSICYGIVQTGKDTPDGVPTVRAGDLKNGYFDVKSLKKVDKEIEKNYPRSRLSGSELLISIRGSVGYVGIPTSEMQGINVSREVAVIPMNRSLTQKYLSYYFQSPIVQNYLKLITKGVAQQGINLNQLRTLPVPVPSIIEQNDIVNFLDDLLEKEKIINQNFEMLNEDNLNKLSQTLLSRAFRGELGTTDLAEKNALC